MKTFTLAFLVIVLALAACGDDDTAVATTTSPTTTAAPAVTTTTTAVPAEERFVCDQPLGAGFSQIQCEDMTFDIALPEECLKGSCGVIVDVHGDSMSGALAEGHTGMQGLGNAAGYVVVQPNSTSTQWTYADDSGRIRSFLDQLIEALDVDRNRVHIGGASAGGFMTWVFVCDHADLIASAAPLAAGATTGRHDSCDFDALGSPSQEVDILLVHGRNDSLVPFDTALAQRDLVVTNWEMTEGEILADEPTYHWTRWFSAEGTVFEFLEFDWEGGQFAGHCYPGVTADFGCGADTPVHYGEAALAFYIAHPKDE